MFLSYYEYDILENTYCHAFFRIVKVIIVYHISKYLHRREYRWKQSLLQSFSVYMQQAYIFSSCAMVPQVWLL